MHPEGNEILINCMIEIYKMFSNQSRIALQIVPICLKQIILRIRSSKYHCFVRGVYGKIVIYHHETLFQNA